MKSFAKLFLLIFLFFSPNALLADSLQINLPGFYFNHQLLAPHQSHFFNSAQYPKGFKTFPKSYRSNDFKNTALLPKKSRNLVGRKTFDESFFELKGDDYFVSLDPLFNLLIDAENGLDGSYINTRGALLKGQLGKKVQFHSVFFENQAFFPDYLRRNVQYSGAAFGMGRVKPFKVDGYDFAIASAVVDVAFNKYFELQFGHGKNFIGEGYRSLLLSDVAFSYPFAKFLYQILDGKLRLESMFNAMSSLQRVPGTLSSEAQFQPKLGSFHYLSFNPSEKLSIGLFEGNIWNNWDSTGSQNVDVHFFNPLPIVSGAINFENNSRNKSVFGLNFAYSPKAWTLIYAQYLLDENALQQENFQVGMRLSPKINSTTIPYFQLEYNQLTEGTYRYASSLQAYNHYGQHLAHALGNNLNEWVINTGFIWNRWQLSAKWISASVSRNPNNFSEGNSNIFQYQNSINEKTAFVDQDYALAFHINPNTNLMLRLGVMFRSEIGFDQNLSSSWFYFSLTSALHNLYFDL